MSRLNIWIWNGSLHTKRFQLRSVPPGSSVLPWCLTKRSLCQIHESEPVETEEIKLACLSAEPWNDSGLSNKTAVLRSSRGSLYASVGNQGCFCSLVQANTIFSAPPDPLESFFFYFIFLKGVTIFQSDFFFSLVMKLVASAGQSLHPGNVIMLFIKDQGYKLKVPLPLFS